MAYNKDRSKQEVNAGSMADIAFLLLIFFLVTTQIATNKGLTMVLPPKRQPEDPIIKLHDRNIFKIQINTEDKILVENEILQDLDQIDDMVYAFVLNFGQPGAQKKGAYKMSDQETFQSLPAAMQAKVRTSYSDINSSDGPSEAVVSLKTDRGSSYEMFIKVFDKINEAYYTIYGERVGLTAEEYRKLNRNDPRQRFLYEQGKRGINKGISLAEPTKQGG